MNLNVLSESAVTDSNRVNNALTTTSFFTEALNDMMEIKKNSLRINQEFYKGILESGDNPALVLEASDGLLDGIKNIIDSFIALIKKIVAKFITALHKIVKSDKYLKKNKNKFSKFNSDNEFEMDIYTYTYIDSDTFPNVSAFNVYKTNTFTPDSVKKYEDGVAYTGAIYDDFMAHLPEWYDKFRGVVLTNSNDPGAITSAQSYTSAEYADELRLKYRNGDSSRTKTTITSVHVLQAYDRFENYDTTIRHVEKLRDQLQKEYNAIKKDIKNITAAYDNIGASGWNFDYKNPGDKYSKGGTLDFDDDYTDADKKKKMDTNITNFIKAKSNQIEQMCTIHTMAFTAKLDAIKEAYVQDKKLLYTALKKINKTWDYKNESAVEYADDIPFIL